jgi:hypothetical protein
MPINLPFDAFGTKAPMRPRSRTACTKIAAIAARWRATMRATARIATA